MALAGRPQRRDGGRRLLVAGMIITILVVLIDASLKSRDPSTGPKLAADTWIDKVLPIIESSSEQGGTVEQIRSIATAAINRDTITGELSTTVKGAQQASDQLAALHAPSQLAGAAGLLQACMQERALGVSQLANALAAAFAAPSSENGSSEVGDVTGAGQDFLLADQAYKLFAQKLPAAGVHPPPSVWVVHPNNWQSGPVTSYLTTLVNVAAGRQLDQVGITNITLNPAPLNTNGSIQVLGPTKDVDFSVTIANTGTLTENDISILVSIDPSQGNAVFKGTVTSLAPGAGYTYQYGPLNPKPGAPTTLTVMIQGGPGSGLQPFSRSIQFETSSGNGPPVSPSTTTTVPSSSSSSSSGSSSTSSGTGTG